MTNELLIQHQNGTTRTMPMQGSRITFGRAAENDLAFPDDIVLSRRHLTFEHDNGLWYVMDLGSKNGTLLNGQKLNGNERQLLRLGDRVAAGHVTMIYDDPVKNAEHTVIFIADDAVRAPSVSTKLEKVVGEGQEAPDALMNPAFAFNPRTKALLDAGKELEGDRPLPELFSKILELAVHTVGARRGVVMTVENGVLLPRAALGEQLKISSAVRDRVMNHRESLLSADTTQDEGLRGSMTLVQQRVRSLMAVPLQTKGTVIGLIYVDTQEFVRTFSAGDLEMLTMLANIAAIRIENARLDQVEQQERLLQKELDQAADIQRNLLPKSAPAVAGLDLAGMSVPCRSVGGDYFDYLKLPGGKLVIICGDVAGKGMAAALLMSSLQARVQLLCEDTDDVGLLVTRLNRSVAATCPGNRFITFFLCIYDPASRDLWYCNAGHNPPYIRHGDGVLETLSEGGPVLGILKNISYQARRVTFAPGDLLLMYSDGVTEALSPQGEEYGEPRLEAELIRAGGGTAPEVMRTVYQSVEGFMADAPAADDITLVAARRL